MARAPLSPALRALLEKYGFDALQLERDEERVRATGTAVLDPTRYGAPLPQPISSRTREA